MSLRVWLPLTKDLRNQGLDDVTITNNGATFDVNGKLGGCYSFNGSNNKIEISNAPNPNNISIAMWFKRNANTNTRQFLYTQWNGITVELQADGKLACSIDTADGQTGYCRSTVAITTSSGWNHIAYTYKEGVGTNLYLNGTLIASAIVTKPIRWSTTVGNIGYYNTYFNGLMNDFRIYDHALSAFEIKEISKGLILHYPLNRNGWGQENLWRNSSCQDNLDGIFQNTVKFTITTKDGYKCAHLSGVKGSSNATGYLSIPDAMVPEAGAWYTISADMRIDNYSAGSTNPYVGIYFNGDYLNTDNTGGWYGGRNYSGDGKADAQTFVNTYNNKGWHRVTCTAQYIHGGDEYKKGAFQMGYIYARDFTGDLYVKNIKFEKGKIATPWCPNSSDTLAATMGLNDNIEYDTSGYNHNLKNFNKSSFSSDTPKYNVSTKLAGTSYGTHQYLFLNDSYQKELTVSCWVKRTSSENVPRYISNSWVVLYLYSDFTPRISWRNSTGTSDVLNTWAPGGAIPINTWTHICFTIKDGIVKYYKNGTHISTSDRTQYGTLIHGSLSNGFGGESLTSKNWVGELSDFRFYCTAISTEDVKSLYNNSAYIDNQGNIYGAMYEEV